jgi:hypothetical protein
MPNRKRNVSAALGALSVGLVCLAEIGLGQGRDTKPDPHPKEAAVLPYFDVEGFCKDHLMGELICLESEQASYNEAKGKWQALTQTDRQRCERLARMADRRSAFEFFYGQLASCTNSTLENLAKERTEKEAIAKFKFQR